MAGTSQLRYPQHPGPGQRENAIGAGLLAFLAVIVGSVLLGLLGGLLWSHLAPRPLYVVVSRGTAAVVNPETSAFIAADGWFCVMAVVGGLLTGLLGYVFAVRRYGALPMLGVLAGALAAAYAAMLLGQRTGRASFYSQLATSRRGTLLLSPVSLGSHEALAFWPLAAGLVAGGIEAVVFLRLRRQARGPRRGAHAAGPALPAEPADPHRPGEACWPGEWPTPGGPAPHGDTS